MVDMSDYANVPNVFSIVHQLKYSAYLPETGHWRFLSVLGVVISRSMQKNLCENQSQAHLLQMLLQGFF
jgi:hypothetical protein